ncbi:MAG TPA: hypothetical protein VL356_05765 [Acidocella sp.]|nr:hypothetical protein [Acidocella sp.]
MNKKKQKNFIGAGPWALALTTPMAQHPQKRSADSTIARAVLPRFSQHFTCQTAAANLESRELSGAA